MIYAPLTGNFGNNLASYLLVRVVAEKNGYEFGFNPSPEFDYYRGKPQLDFMDIDYGIIHNYKYNDVPDFIENVWVEQGTSHTTENDTYDFVPYQPDIFNQPDNTKFIIRSGQDARYYNEYKSKIKEWIKIKEENEFQYALFLLKNDIILNEDVCILNLRGGEYRGVPNLLLSGFYRDKAINKMLEKNPNMRFIAVTDDPNYVNQMFNGTIPIIHHSIGGDYFILNNAKNLILSNSSFALFPVWLNSNNPYVIAPKYWARHNVSSGYWCASDIWTFAWEFMDRNGNLFSFNQIQEEERRL